MKTIHAQLKTGRGTIAAVEIPADEEIDAIAMRMHKSGKPCLETILGWKAFYRPRHEFSITSQCVDPFTSEQGHESSLGRSVAAAEFTFGYDGPWKIVLSWNDGDDKPPKWFRYEEKLNRQVTGQLL